MSWLSRLFGQAEENCGNEMRGHNCMKTLKNLQTLLDGELTKVEEDQLIEEINKCPECLKHYKVEQSFKDFVKHRCRKKVDPNLVRNIWDKVHAPGHDA